MDDEARLARALGAPAAPKRDAAFTLGVMREAERQRFRRAWLLSLLRTAGVAAAAAALAVPLMGWAPGNLAALQNGLLTAGSLLALVSFARIMSQRLSIAAR
jgi:hypothetical protein